MNSLAIIGSVLVVTVFLFLTIIPLIGSASQWMHNNFNGKDGYRKNFVIGFSLLLFIGALCLLGLSFYTVITTLII